MLFGVLFFPKSCLNVGGAAYTRVFTVLGDRAVMLQSLFWANGICFDAQSIDVTITCKNNQFPVSEPMCIFFKIVILIFERSKKTERKKKIYRPRIEPVSRQNKLESGPFSALSLALTKQK